MISATRATIDVGASDALPLDDRAKTTSRIDFEPPKRSHLGAVTVIKPMVWLDSHTKSAPST
jgi:hypothetical protein